MVRKIHSKKKKKKLVRKLHEEWRRTDTQFDGGGGAYLLGES